MAGPASLPATSPGLLGRLASTGLVVGSRQNTARFVHPVIGGYLAGRGLSAYKAGDTLIDQPDWIGKFLTMRYFAAHGDVNALVDMMLQWSRLPMHRPLLNVARWLRDSPQGAPWRIRIMSALADLVQTSGLPLSLRGQALAALICSDDPSVAALFRQLMAGASGGQQQLAALGSGALRDEKAVGDIAPMLQLDQQRCTSGGLSCPRGDWHHPGSRTRWTGASERRRRTPACRSRVSCERPR